jgi:hypothetical protein
MKEYVVQSILGVGMFSKDIVPSMQTSSRYFIGTDRRIIFEKLGNVWMVEDCTSIYKNGLKCDYIVFVVLVFNSSIFPLPRPIQLLDLCS